MPLQPIGEVPASAHRILVVEDEAVIAMDLAQNLRDFGYEVVGIAANGERARQLAHEQQPDLILMDIVIRGPSDGIDTARQIQAEFDVPVVFLTAYGDSATLQRAKNTMPYGYLMKPFRSSDLRTTIEVALHKHAMDRRVRESERWLTRTLECIGDGIVATDPQGLVRFLNPVAESLLGVQDAEALGRQAREVFTLCDEATGAPGPDLVARALASSEQTELVSGVLPPGEARRPIHLDAGAAPIRDDDGRLLGAVLVFRDVTQRRLAEAELTMYREHLEQLVRERTMELETARNEAERANRAKSQFLSAMSHELRTPMNAILGFSELLRDEPLSQENALFVRNIHEAGKHLLRLIDDLLDMGRIEAGQFNTTSQPVAVAALLDALRPLVDALLSRHQVRLELAHGPELSVQADATRLKQVLLNLLSNAIKYNHPGGHVRLGMEQRPGARVRINVHDSGPGIAPERQGLLFQPFQRLGAEHSGVDGMGLGLALSKQLVEMMDGELGVDSTPGVGSTFWIELPQAATS
ncbi:MAG TPA: ATP-binding protein [Burkholderiaceae bacterium]|nr:ATP-binding protein [Burkholderiaceae bacterium]